jgi:endonuclease-3
MSQSLKKKRERAVKIDSILSELYPHDTALRFENILQLLVATILSAQCTDGQVNKVTPALFAKYPDAKAFAGADLEDLEQIIFSTGFYRQKAKSIKGCCEAIVRDHGGKVPLTMVEMVKLPGVGRKTANLVLGIAPFSSELIYLGRDKCTARKPKCDECPVEVLCPKINVET